MQSLPDALRPMAVYRQFIACRLVPQDSGKTTKLPCDFRTGAVDNAHNPAIWTDAQTAINACLTLGSDYRPGFVFTPNDPFFFIDIDNAWDGSQWSPIAMELCTAFAGAAVEISQSGTGLHIFGVGSAPAHSCKNVQLGIEFYTQERFVVLSGTNATGSAGTSHSDALALVTGAYFPPRAESVTDGNWTTEPCDEWRGPEDNTELIRRALLSQSAEAAFGNRASFRDLWECNIDKLSRAYPDSGDRAYDGSSADAALAQHLAFWTGKNCERIQELMQESGLVRGKWERDDYLPRTILNACALQRDVLTDKAPATCDTLPAIVSDDTPKARLVDGNTTILCEAQLNFFAGCVYISDVHKVLVPGGYLLKPEQFKVNYGGRLFSMDPANEKMVSDAWECFTGSKAIQFPKARSTCFRPDLPPAKIITEDGKDLANSYWPVETTSIAGDVTPFLAHLEKVLPVATDRHILLAYMAALVQHKGVKFQWTPLIQGVEGNGKTLFSRCVAAAIGERYCHWPRADQITEKFNAWIFNKIFIGVEDIYVPHDKKEVLDALKPMITNDRLEKRAMNTDQTTEFICANFILNSNHKDGIKKTQNDRRFAPMFCAQQEHSDLTRDGMTGDYFPKLYSWLRSGGYAAVTNFLEYYPIPPHLNPATECHRAPTTSSTAEAIQAGMGGVEQHVEEAIAQGRPGFCGGWVSSIALGRLLDDLRIGGRIPLNKRRDLMKSIGYDQHPGLRGGRVDNTVAIDGGKPILYVLKGSAGESITGGTEIAKAYSAAQAVPANGSVII